MQQMASVEAEGEDPTVYFPLQGFTAVDLGYQQGNALSNLVNKFTGSPMTDGYLRLFEQIWNDKDKLEEVTVYAKLPRGFAIPTPVGDYNPDWAIAFDSGKVRHVYFIAETKGSMSSLDLRLIEESKISCARKFFAKISGDQVQYDVVNSYGKLMEVVIR